MMLPRLRLASRLALLPGVLILGSAGPSARAQQSFNPPGFDPYSAPYRAYAFPGAGNDPSIPNSQISGAGLVMPNPLDRLGNFDEDVFSSGSNASTGYVSGRYRRYDSAFRMRDQALGREFTPNEKADAEYYSLRKKREEIQMKAMRETDPQKREALLKKLDRLTGASADPSMSVRRGESTGPRPAATPRRAATPARPRATTPAAPAPVTAPATARARTAAANPPTSAASGSTTAPR